MAPSVQLDQASFRHGRGLALAGLAIQVALAVGAAATAAWTGSSPLAAVTWQMLGGLPIWIVLALWFGQRAAERREALAADQLAEGDAATAMIFGEVSDELQRVRQRLDLLVRYGLPGVSLLVGGWLVVGGGLFLWRAAEPGGGGESWVGSAARATPVSLLFVTGGLTFFAFVAGRWISGCGRVPAWQLLRGGASYLMSCFLVAGLAFGSAAILALTGDPAAFRVLGFAVPTVMLVIGGEILLAALLELYRPRRPGELPRPAFDSRLLGLLTTPESLGTVIGELVRYQFGVEVSGNWLIRLVGRSVTPLSLLAGGVLAALSCLVVVGPDEEGLILRGGAVRGSAIGPGVHVKLPWPIETAVTAPTQRVLQLSVSSDLAGRSRDSQALLWTGGDDRLAHIGKEYYPVLLSARGSGLAVVDAEVVIHYRIAELQKFLANAPAAASLVAAIAQQETSRYLADHDLDDLLAHGRVAGGREIAAGIQRRADGLDLGIAIVDASITALQPPGGAVARSFHRQVAAEQERETLVERARRDAVRTLAGVAGSVALGERLDVAILALDAARAGSDASPELLAGLEAEIDTLLATARGEAAERIHAARGLAWTRIVAEQTARERFIGELAAYEQAPSFYRAGRFFDVLAGSLADRRKFVIVGDDGEPPVLQLDFADPASAIDTLLGD
jgi:membrane protease subunit HflK